MGRGFASEKQPEQDPQQRRGPAGPGEKKGGAQKETDGALGVRGNGARLGGPGCRNRRGRIRQVAALRAIVLAFGVLPRLPSFHVSGGDARAAL